MLAKRIVGAFASQSCYYGLKAQVGGSLLARIFIVGGAGFIGQHIAGRLCAEGHEVAVSSRKTLDLGRDDEIRMRETLLGHKVVVNCAGVARENGVGTMARVHGAGTIRLIRAAAAAGVKCFVHISALGVSSEGETNYQRSKAVAEDFFNIFDPQGARLDWRVLRPSVVIGRGGASFDLQLALAVLPLVPSVGQGQWRIQPVHIDDLTELVARLVEAAKGPRKLDVVGPDAITTNELSTVLRDWLGLPAPKFFNAPTTLLKIGAAFAGRFTRLPLNSELITMLACGNTSDPAALTAALGRPPRKLRIALALQPACDADRIAARLYFLKSPLRWSIALLWIVSGILSFGVYPVEKSYELLRELHLTGAPAALALYEGATADLLLGLLLLARWRPVLVGLLQLAFLAAFTLLATGLPADNWLHPFAPLMKNLPIAAAILVMIALEA